MQPELVAELLILRPEMPRSLIACHAQVEDALERIATASDDRRGEPQRIAAEMHGALRGGSIDSIFEQGLHEWLTAQIDRNVELDQAIQALYLNV